MVSTDRTVVAFDLYGTLLSTESIVKELATHFEYEKAQSISALWRRFQLEYTWRMNSMSLYKPFSEITEASLHHALAEFSVTLSEIEIANLMKAYDALETFPDVAPALRALAEDSTTDAYVFTNGTDAMVTSSVHSSPSLSPYASVFKDLITVQEVEVFKPDPKTYYHLAEKVGKTRSKEDMGSIWLVSGNPFDIVGARAMGMQAVWVDRAGGHSGNGGWNDRLGELAGGGPTVVVKSIEEVIAAITESKKEKHARNPGHSKEAAALGSG